MPPPKAKAKASEQQIQTAIKGFLELKGYFVLRINSGAIRTQGGGLVRLAPPGTPDLLVIGPEGYVAWLEIKTPQGRLTEYQKAMHRRLKGLGQAVLVVRSLSEVVELIEEREEQTEFHRRLVDRHWEEFKGKHLEPVKKPKAVPGVIDYLKGES